MNEMITIKKRFVGPPGMGNGGYICGILARNLPGAVEVTLLRPAPLEQSLTLQHSNGSHQLLDGDSLIGEAQPATLTLNLPEPPDYETAIAARSHYLENATQHPFPNCFVCGPNRKYGDGLQIYPALIPERNFVATAWEPDSSLVDESGFVAPQFLWAALDCPGGIVAVADLPRPIVLGRMTAQLLADVRPHNRCIVIGWPVTANGRKHTVGTAIFTETGLLIGKALAIWIELQ